MSKAAKEQSPDLAAENAELKAKLKEAQAAIEDMAAVNAQLQDVIESHAAAVPEIAKAKEKPSIPSKSFKVDGVDYVFTVPQFTNPTAGHSVITAKEALTDSALLEYLVKNDCGVTERKGK